jgi:hypothetical protein
MNHRNNTLGADNLDEVFQVFGSLSIFAPSRRRAIRSQWWQIQRNAKIRFACAVSASNGLQ